MEMDYPKTRMDNFFAKAAGSELADDSMEPITDREYWIDQMATKINSGGGGGGSNVVVYAGTYNEDFTEISIQASFNDVTAEMAQGKIVMVLVDASEEDAPNYESKMITLAFYRDSVYYAYLSPSNDAAANGGEAEMESATANLVFELGK